MLVTSGETQQKLRHGLRLKPGLLLKENVKLYDLYGNIESQNIFLKPVSSMFFIYSRI